MTEEECDSWAIGSFQAFAELKLFIYGYIYEEGQGLFLLAPKEEIARIKIFQNENVIDFDFENYIANADGRFWMANYLTDKGPTLQKMIK